MSRTISTSDRRIDNAREGGRARGPHFVRRAGWRRMAALRAELVFKRAGLLLPMLIDAKRRRRAAPSRRRRRPPREARLNAR